MKHNLLMIKMQLIENYKRNVTLKIYLFFLLLN